MVFQENVMTGEVYFTLHTYAASQERSPVFLL